MLNINNKKYNKQIFENLMRLKKTYAQKHILYNEKVKKHNIKIKQMNEFKKKMEMELKENEIIEEIKKNKEDEEIKIIEEIKKIKETNKKIIQELEEKLEHDLNQNNNIKMRIIS